MAIIQLENVEKSYGEHKVLKGIDLEVEKGEIYGLLGPNGAGKTTLFQTILGLLKQDAGKVTINGSTKKGKQVKREIGYLPSDISFYENRTALENLRFFADMVSKEPDFEELLELLDLEEEKDRKVGEFSTGMKKRLGIAQSLIKDPEIAIYDEPTTGLDPEGKKKFQRHMEKINSEKDMTVIISSHITGKISPLCDRFGILADGVIAASGTKKELSKEAGTEVELEIVVQEPGKCEEVLEELGKDFARDQNTFEVKAKEKRSKILEKLVENRCSVKEFYLKKSTLEAAYLELAGE